MRCIFYCALVALAGCTAGAPASGSASGGATTLIHVSLTAATTTLTAYGTSAAYTPAVTTLSVGTTVQFINDDSFTHTASSLGSVATFPQASPLGAGALDASGSRLSTGWTSGALAPGAASVVLTADVAGTYLYGCFFHYAAPMRGAIVVQ